MRSIPLMNTRIRNALNDKTHKVNTTAQQTQTNEEDLKTIYLQILNDFFQQLLIQCNNENLRTQGIDAVKQTVLQKTNEILNETNNLPPDIKAQLEKQFNAIFDNLSFQLQSSNDWSDPNIREELISQVDKFFDNQLATNPLINKATSEKLNMQTKDTIRAFDDGKNAHLIFILAALKAQLDQMHNEFSKSRLQEMLYLKNTKELQAQQHQQDIMKQANVYGGQVIVLTLAGALIVCQAINPKSFGQTSFGTFQLGTSLITEGVKYPSTIAQSKATGSSNILESTKQLNQEALQRIHQDDDAKRRFEETFSAIIQQFTRAIDSSR